MNDRTARGAAAARAPRIEQHLETQHGESPHAHDNPRLHADLAVLACRAHYINVAISLATIAALRIGISRS